MMLGLLKKSAAIVLALNAAISLATPIDSGAGIEKRASGFANAVYFTNWFVNNPRQSSYLIAVLTYS